MTMNENTASSPGASPELSPNKDRSMTSEQRRLAEENHNLIYWFLHENHFSMDYYGSAALGLCLAAMRFDPSYGTKFSTYAKKAMRLQILRDMDAEKNSVPCTMSLDDFVSEDIMETKKDRLIKETACADPQSFTFISCFLDNLPLFELRIILHSLQGMSQREIGRLMGYSGQPIMKRIHTMRTALTKNLNNRRWKVEPSVERNNILNEIHTILL